jgi:ABC-type amino acid transport substrate-binding protein
LGKKAILFLTFAIAMSIFSGCKSKSSKITKLEDLNNKTLGTLALSNLNEDYLLDMFSTTYSTELKSVNLYDSASSLIMALDTGKIDAALLRDFHATAYSTDSDKYSILPSSDDSKITGYVRMAAAKDTPAATDIKKINDALAQLKDDGTFDTLKKEYIDDFSFSKNFESISMPKIDGAPTYKISISGSMIPLDYIAADGNPTGYSIALLSKVSEIAKINFELVTVGIDTQELELISSKTDYIFCYTLTDERMETETELTFSDPYYSYSATVLLVKK